MTNIVALCFENQKKNFLFILCLMSFSLSTTAFAQATIEVFVDHPLVTSSIPNAIILVFDLSRVAQLEEDTPDFPPDPMLAQAQAQTWLESSAGKNHLMDLKAAYAGHEKMVNYGLQKIPAIVFENGRFVIYGTTDVATAVKDYDNFLQIHNEGTAHETKK